TIEAAGKSERPSRRRAAKAGPACGRGDGNRKLSIGWDYPELNLRTIAVSRFAGPPLLARGLALFPLLPLEEGLLDLLVGAHEPCFRTRGAVAEMRGFGLQIPGSFLGGTQLKRKLVCEVHGPRTILLRHVCCFLQHRDDRAPGIVGHHVCIRLWPRRRRKLD